MEGIKKKGAGERPAEDTIFPAQQGRERLDKD
jgi:hypothetical protein